MSSSLAAAFLKKYQSKPPATNDVALNEKPTVPQAAASPSASSARVNGGSEERLCTAELPSCVSDWIIKHATRENWRVEVPADISCNPSDSSQQLVPGKTPIAVAIPMGGDSTAVGSLRIAGLQQRNNFPFDWAHSSPMSLRRLIRGRGHGTPRDGEDAGVKQTVETAKKEAPNGNSYHKLLLRIDSELQSAVNKLLNNEGALVVSGGSEIGLRHLDPASDAFVKAVQKTLLLPREENNTTALQSLRKVGICSQYQEQAHGAMTTFSSLDQETSISGYSGLVGWNTSDDDEAIVDSSETRGNKLGESKVVIRKKRIRDSCWSLALRYEVAKRVMAIEKQLTSASLSTSQERIENSHSSVDASPLVFGGYYRWLLGRHHHPRSAHGSAQSSDDHPTLPTYFTSHIKGSINFATESLICGGINCTSSTENDNRMEGAQSDEIGISGAGNGSLIGHMTPSPFVFDPFYGVVAKTSEAKALWPRCVHVPIVLSQLRLRYLLATSNKTRNPTQSKPAGVYKGGNGQHTCARVANHARQRFSILLLYTGRSSGDMMCLLPCVDGAPILSAFPSSSSSTKLKSTQSPSPTSSHLDGNERLSKNEEQAALFKETLQTAIVIGNYVTRGKLSGDENSIETPLEPSRMVHSATISPSTTTEDLIFTVHVVMINVFDAEKGNFDLRITPTRTSVSQQDKESFGIVLHSRFVGFPSSKRPWDNVMSMTGDHLGKMFELEK